MNDIFELKLTEYTVFFDRSNILSIAVPDEDSKNIKEKRARIFLKEKVATYCNAKKWNGEEWEILPTLVDDHSSEFYVERKVALSLLAFWKNEPQPEGPYR